MLIDSRWDAELLLHTKFTIGSLAHSEPGLPAALWLVAALGLAARGGEDRLHHEVLAVRIQLAEVVATLVGEGFLFGHILRLRRGARLL